MIRDCIHSLSFTNSYILKKDHKGNRDSYIHTFTCDFIHLYISHKIYFHLKFHVSYIHSHLKFHALFMYSHVNSIHAFLKKKNSFK